MTNVTSWKFWVILALALGTLACANREERRERREERQEARRDRADARYQARLERERERREARGDVADAPRQTARERAEERRAQRQARTEQRRERAEPQRETRPEPAAAAPAAVAPAADDGSSRIVFMRVSKQTSSTEAALFDVTEAQPRFIGNVGPASKLAYHVKPGLYTFMVVGETADFMQATIVGGKTYYALVIPRAGATRFAIEPVRRDELGGKEFQGWDRGTRAMAGEPKGQGDVAAAEDKRKRHWPEFMGKPESQRAALTINAEDGR